VPPSSGSVTYHKTAWRHDPKDPTMENGLGYLVVRLVMNFVWQLCNLDCVWNVVCVPHVTDIVLLECAATLLHRAGAVG